jgi:hypothetical protein
MHTIASTHTFAARTFSTPEPTEMENPYQAPVHIPAPPSPPFHWARLIAWAILIYLAANLVGVLSGISMVRWEIYGHSIDEAIANARTVRRIALFIIGIVLYWRFAAGVTSRRLLHVLALFVLVTVIDLPFDYWLYATPANQLIDPSSSARHILAALLGLGIAWLGSRRSGTSAKTPPDSSRLPS